MKPESMFRTLDPPPGGLDRLRNRLHYRSVSRYWLPAAAAACLVVVIAWFGHDRPAGDAESLMELRQILEDAKPPPLAIDGKQPTRLDIDTDHAVVYWLDAQEDTGVPRD
jgi:hypothetical protein